ncbi:hypothetical protein HYV10_01080 [Candidatus Dependentiae bacterium]|nr:hypothetical protein [Candidatus Dependentiae bacterium]
MKKIFFLTLLMLSLNQFNLFSSCPVRYSDRVKVLSIEVTNSDETPLSLTGMNREKAITLFSKRVGDGTISMKGLIKIILIVNSTQNSNDESGETFFYGVYPNGSVRYELLERY